MGAYPLSSTPKGVSVARELPDYGEACGAHDKAWDLGGLAGRFIEITGGTNGAVLTAAARLILQAQQHDRLAAWIGRRTSTFYPPDFAASGIDLNALPVIRTPDGIRAARAADTLLRSGGFAVVVLDLGRKANIPLSAQSRLAGLAKKHNTALVCLTRNDQKAAPLGPLVCIRAEAHKTRDDFDRFACALRIVKDKRLGAGANHVEVCRGPDGLC